MPVVFVLASDWTMRVAVRAELRESGIDALGMDSAEDAGRALASSGLPDVIVLEATADLLNDIRIRNLIQRVPSILVASHTLEVALPDADVILYRPVRVSEIVDRVRELLGRTNRHFRE